MGRTIGLLVCLSVVAMDLTAGVLGITAEAAQDQMKHVKLWLFECKEPSHEAFTLGAAAATLLGLAHVVANMLGTCTICSQQGTQKASPSRHCSLACLLLTWAALAVGLALLVIGTISNHKSRATCGFTDRHYLFVGGILCFVHAGFSTGYYLTATA